MPYPLLRSRFRFKRGGAALLLLAALAALAVLVLLLVRLDRNATTRSLPSEDGATVHPVVMYCAAGMRLPVEKIATLYREEHGTEIQLQYGGSNTLLNQIELARTGDLFLAADNRFLELAREKNLLAQILPIAEIHAVIVVPRGNPKQIDRLTDLLREDVRVALANPDQAAVGAVVRDVLQSQMHWRELERAVTRRGVFQPTVSEVANTVKVGAADAGIVWDITVAADPQLQAFIVPELAKARGEVGVGVLNTSTQPGAARRFARYLTDPKRGLPVFKDAGYDVLQGSAASESDSRVEPPRERKGLSP